MTVAACKPSRIASLRLILAIALAAAALGGAVLIQRGPDPIFQAPLDLVRVSGPEGNALYVQRFETTVAEWNTCFEGGGCAIHLRTRPDQDPAQTPATGLSHDDVSAYINWINSVSGTAFRLPSLAEWTHIAKPVLPAQVDPIFTDPSLTWASAYLTEGLAPRALLPQGSFAISPEGIGDLNGSVWEWTQDCYAGVAEGTDPAHCPAYFVGGEHVSAMSYLVRDPARGGCAVGSPPAHLGMRLVSDAPAG